jgi:hypothetical protein
VPRTDELPRPVLDDAVRRRRRQEVLDALTEAAQLKARLRPRSSALARARSVLHNRTTRG